MIIKFFLFVYVIQSVLNFNFFYFNINLTEILDNSEKRATVTECYFTFDMTYFIMQELHKLSEYLNSMAEWIVINFKEIFKSWNAIVNKTVNNLKLIPCRKLTSYIEIYWLDTHLLH